MSGSSSDQEEKKVQSEDEKEEPEPKSPAGGSDDKNDEKAVSSSPKKEEDDDDSNDKNEESDESEKGVGLLDRPVEVSGARERKKVQRLELSFSTAQKDEPEIPEGCGKKLGDCPRIEQMISRNKPDELKILHKILFNRLGSGHSIRKNIRKFNGFPFQKTSADYNKKKKIVEKITQRNLKHICEILDLERGGTKDEVVCRIMDFLIEPKPSGKEVHPPKKKVSGKGVKRKREVKKGKASKAKKVERSDGEEGDALSDDDHDDENDDEHDKDENDHDKDDEHDDDPNDDDNDDASEEEPKKERKTPAKKETKASAKKKVNKEKPKKVEKKKSTPKQSKKKQVESSDGSDSDDEPLVKKTKSPPTNEEIKVLVKKILDTSDLQQITMKTVVKQVFDAFPEFDLSDKKDFIKTTVKSVIS